MKWFVVAACLVVSPASAQDDGLLVTTELLIDMCEAEASDLQLICGAYVRGVWDAWELAGAFSNGALPSLCLPAEISTVQIVQAILPGLNLLRGQDIRAEIAVISSIENTFPCE